MTKDEMKLFLASITYDLDSLQKNPLKSKDFVFANSKLCGKIPSSTSLFDEAKNEVIALLIKRDAPYTIEGDIGEIKVNKNIFSFDKLVISRYLQGFPLSQSHYEDDVLSLDNFPLKANVLLNDVFIDIVGHKKDEVTEIARSVNQESFFDRSSEDKEPAKASPDDRSGLTSDKLIMTAYRITYPGDKGDKVMTVIIAPLLSPVEASNSFSIPVFALAKMDGKIATSASIDSRASVLLSIGGESVTLKGTWSGDKFKTFVYPQKIQGRAVKIVKQEYSPAHPDTIGHFMVKDGCEIHILPMSTKNNEDGYVQFIVCLREISSQGNTKNTVGVAADGKVFRIKGYEISCRWEDDTLKVSVNGQKKQNQS